MKFRTITILALLLAILAPASAQLPDDYNAPDVAEWCTSTELIYFFDLQGPELWDAFYTASDDFDARRPISFDSYFDRRDQMWKATPLCWPVLDLTLYTTQAYAELMIMQFYRDHHESVPPSLLRAHKQTLLYADIAILTLSDYSQEVTNRGEASFDNMLSTLTGQTATEQLIDFCPATQVIESIRDTDAEHGLFDTIAHFSGSHHDRELLDIQQYLDYRTAVWTSFPPCRPLVDFAVITTQLYVDLILAKAYVSENVLPSLSLPDELSRIVAKANTLGEITQLYATASPDQDHTELNKRVIALLTRIQPNSP